MPCEPVCSSTSDSCRLCEIDVSFMPVPRACAPRVANSSYSWCQTRRNCRVEAKPGALGDAFHVEPCLADQLARERRAQAVAVVRQMHADVLVEQARQMARTGAGDLRQLPCRPRPRRIARRSHPARDARPDGCGCALRAMATVADRCRCGADRRRGSARSPARRRDRSAARQRCSIRSMPAVMPALLRRSRSST